MKKDSIDSVSIKSVMDNMATQFNSLIITFSRAAINLIKINYPRILDCELDLYILD